MNAVSLVQVKRSMRIDFLRLSATGKSSVWVFVLMPLLFVVMGMLGGDEMTTFGFAGSAVGVCGMFASMLPMIVASNEEMSGNSSMNGIIPATRLNQVLARYAFMIVVDILAALEAMVCLVLLLHFDEPPVTSLIGIGLSVLSAALFAGSLLMPLFYRFPATQAIGWGFGLLGLLCLVGFGLYRFVPQSAFLASKTSSLFTTHMGLILGIVAIVAVLICLCSFLISNRIYANKEL